MADRSPAHVVRDLGRKCGDDVSAAIWLSALLVPEKTDRAQIATYGAAHALGVAAGAYVASFGLPVTAHDAVDALWARMRPIVLKAVEDLLAKEQADGAR